MNLSEPFYRFPFRFDTERLRQEVAQFSEDEWRDHPSGYAGNSALPLISAGGDNNDDMAGTMLPTVALERCPYIMQVLAAFETVWGRARLMRLGPGHNVPPHTDLHYYWFNRVRLHVPIITDPDIRFHCEESSVHMAAGEAWTFDNWRTHTVINPTDVTRIHLTADTTGTEAFWNLVERSETGTFPPEPATSEFIPYRPGETCRLRTERFNIGPVAHPAEVDRLCDHLLAALDKEAALPETVAGLTQLLTTLQHEWRSLWSEYGDQREGFKHYEALRDSVFNASVRLREPAPLKLGGSSAISALSGLVLKALVNPELASLGETKPTRSAPQVIVMKQRVLDKPVFIVSAPRSGSTLLFETLAQSKDLWTIGGESHAVFEGQAGLRPGAPGIDSNRLGAGLASQEVARSIRWTFCAMLKNRDGQPFDGRLMDSVRMLEKTPKNALRIPFLDAVFSNGLFIWLYREPRSSISSIMEAWKSGKFVTYRNLAGWDDDWSLLLPPGWQNLKGKSLAEVAAYQWKSANEHIRQDLERLPNHRWTSVDYDRFIEDPAGETQRLCSFMGLDGDDEHLQKLLGGELPLSRFTLTEPGHEKWRINAEALGAVMPELEPLAEQFQAAVQAHCR